MKPYVMTTGVLFALLTVAHIWRMVAEGPGVSGDPFYLGITVLAAALALWAAREEAAPEHLRRLIPDDADRLSASWIETRRQRPSLAKR